MSDGRGVALRLEACAKTFPNGTRALEAVTLHVDRGETVVFLGPSGCGKTTLLRIIAGLEGPDAGGRVLFNGNDVTDVPIERRNVGMVFQSYALFPNMSVAENIGYGLKIRGMSGKERGARITDLMELTGIGGLEQRRIDQLSGGQRQRVALARAVAVHPSVLLLDEPLTALDAALRERLRGELDRLLRTLGITTIYVTHDQAEAMALGDRIVVMRNGAIVQIGSPAASILNRRADLWRSSSAPPTFFRRPWRTDMLCFPEAACACRTAPPRVPRRQCCDRKRSQSSTARAPISAGMSRL